MLATIKCNYVHAAEFYRRQRPTEIVVRIILAMSILSFLKHILGVKFQKYGFLLVGLNQPKLSPQAALRVG
jgi:hypothetical protein